MTIDSYQSHFKGCINEVAQNVETLAGQLNEFQPINKLTLDGVE